MFSQKKRCYTIVIIIFFSVFLATKNLDDRLSTVVDGCISNHDPLYIYGDYGFNIPSITGAGSSSDPFIIENLIIITDYDYAIKIVNVESTFIIRNCTLQAKRHAIEIDGVDFSTFQLLNNTLMSSESYVLDINNYNSSIIANNVFKNCNSGINSIRHSLVANNTFIGIKYGAMHVSTNSTIENNRFYNTGIEVYNNLGDLRTMTFTNNYVNDKPLGFFLDCVSVIIDETKYGQIILMNCSNTLIQNQNLSNTYRGVDMAKSSNITITNSIFSSCFMGIFAVNVQGANISSNLIKENSYNGVHVARSDSFTITNNTYFRNERHGIQMYVVDSSTVYNNLIQSNGQQGIYISGDVFDESESNLIYYNSFFNNNKEGECQAFDDCANKWYEPSLKIGNYWEGFDGDWYLIEGGGVDIYPLNATVHEPLYEEPDKTNSYYLFSSVLFILSYYVIRRRKELFT